MVIVIAVNAFIFESVDGTHGIANLDTLQVGTIGVVVFTVHRSQHGRVHRGDGVDVLGDVGGCCHVELTFLQEAASVDKELPTFVLKAADVLPCQ